jgi:hypothetical protein
LKADGVEKFVTMQPRSMKTFFYVACPVPCLLLLLSFYPGPIALSVALLSDLACLLSLAITPFGVVVILLPPRKTIKSAIILFLATLIAAAPAIVVLSGHGAN